MVVISSVSMDIRLASSLLKKQPSGLRENLHFRRRMKRDFGGGGDKCSPCVTGCEIFCDQVLKTCLLNSIFKEISYMFAENTELLRNKRFECRLLLRWQQNTNILLMYVYMYACLCKYFCIYIYIYIYVCVCVCVYAFTYVCM